MQERRQKRGLQMTFNQFNNYILMRRLKRKTKRDRRDNAPDTVKRKRYFRQQKLYAAALLLATLALVIYMQDGTILAFILPLCIYLLFSKEMWLMNDYYFEVEDREENGYR
ncbi:MAG: hypothetical protein EOM18_02600 [Clostridia bacterium]|nr:hypothetical protein [Clostridia bacterium]